MSDRVRHFNTGLPVRRGGGAGPMRLAVAMVVAAAALAIPSASGAGADDEPIPDQIQSSVDRGLAWLAKVQERDGSWSAGGGGRSAAVTGLAAMAFMARGHVPGQGPYGETLNRAVDFILTLQRNDGSIAERSLSEPMYDHGICTIMLCEVYGMLDEVRQERARGVISRAVRLILNAQNISKSAADQGGWRYSPTTPQSDLSVTGWQLMALRGVANIGAAVPAGAIKSGIDYVKRRANISGSFQYTASSTSASPAAMTATGILALCLLGEPGAREVTAGGDYLLRTPIATQTTHYYYTVYYAEQAAWQLGIADRKYWKNINDAVSNSLFARQKADGSWPASADNDVSRGGESYATAMAILALTVPYRYLPIYQR